VHLLEVAEVVFAGEVAGGVAGGVGGENEVAEAGIVGAGLAAVGVEAKIEAVGLEALVEGGDGLAVGGGEGEAGVGKGGGTGLAGGPVEIADEVGDGLRVPGGEVGGEGAAEEEAEVF
jgi:hypothetical protein